MVYVIGIFYHVEVHAQAIDIRSMGSDLMTQTHFTKQARRARGQRPRTRLTQLRASGRDALAASYAQDAHHRPGITIGLMGTTSSGGGFLIETRIQYAGRAGNMASGPGRA